MKRICVLAIAGLLAGMVTMAAPSAPQATTRTVTFNRDVMPILQENCQVCHRPGQVAPMSFMSYGEVRPWAKALKAAVLTRKMPPWFADPRYGHFANDRSLKQKDIDTLVAWVDAGALEGDVKDRPAPKFFPADGWVNGREPDFVLEMKPFTVPVLPKGQELGFVEVNFETPFIQDTWISAIEIKPGNRAVVHHVGADARYPQPGGKCTVDNPGEAEIVRRGLSRQGVGENAVTVAAARGDNSAAEPRASKVHGVVGSAGLGGFSPGHEVYRFTSARPEAARLIPAGSCINMQLHYSSTGVKPETDVTKIGLYILKDAKYRFVNVSLSGNTRQLKTVPWGEANYEIRNTYTAQRDVEIAWFQPHMHWRGKDMTYKITFPDGKTETMMKVNKFAFDWQLNYELTKPIFAPKGTKVEVIAHYDNSPNNQGSPYVGEAMEWGDQTWEEMFIGFLGVYIPAADDTKSLFTPDGPLQQKPSALVEQEE